MNAAFGTLSHELNQQRRLCKLETELRSKCSALQRREKELLHDVESLGREVEEVRLFVWHGALNACAAPFVTKKRDGHALRRVREPADGERSQPRGLGRFSMTQRFEGLVMTCDYR